MKIETNNFTGFFKPHDKNGYLSNWYNVNFVVDGIRFTSSEQYMMYSKAMFFNDISTANEILRTRDNQKIKQLGREVKPFNAKMWDKACKEIMFNGLCAKFSQNEDLKRQLLSTGNSVIAECSPYDKIWGIGMSVNDFNRFYTERWNGRNYLGTILMEVREKLRVS